MKYILFLIRWTLLRLGEMGCVCKEMKQSIMLNLGCALLRSANFGGNIFPILCYISEYRIGMTKQVLTQEMSN